MSLKSCLTVAALCLVSTPALAQLEVCNASNWEALYAVGTSSGGSAIRAAGWRSVDPGQCDDYTPPDGTDQAYIYGYSDSWEYEWTGNTRLCVNMGLAFDYEDAAGNPCDGASEERVNYSRVTLSPESSPSGKYTFTDETAFRRITSMSMCNETEAGINYALAYTTKQEPAPRMSKGWYELKSGACKNTRVRGDLENPWVFGVDDSYRRWEGSQPLCVAPMEAFFLPQDATNPCTSVNRMVRRFAPIQRDDDTYHYAFTAQDMTQPIYEVTMCNGADETLLAIRAFDDSQGGGSWATRGNTVLAPGECTSKKYYDEPVLYVRAGASTGATWSGPDTFCIDFGSSAFYLPDADSRPCDGLFEAQVGFRYFELVAGSPNTITLSEENADQ